MHAVARCMDQEKQARGRIPDGWDGDRHLTIPEVLGLLGYSSRTTLQKLVHQGELHPVRRGRTIRFLASDVQKYLAGGQK